MQFWRLSKVDNSDFTSNRAKAKGEDKMREDIQRTETRMVDMLTTDMARTDMAKIDLARTDMVTVMMTMTKKTSLSLKTTYRY